MHHILAQYDRLACQTQPSKTELSLLLVCPSLPGLPSRFVLFGHMNACAWEPPAAQAVCTECIVNCLCASDVIGHSQHENLPNCANFIRFKVLTRCKFYKL